MDVQFRAFVTQKSCRHHRTDMSIVSYEVFILSLSKTMCARGIWMSYLDFKVSSYPSAHTWFADSNFFFFANQCHSRTE